MFFFISGSCSNAPEEGPETWMVGSARGAVLKFHCSALSDPPSDPPANELHMTYKTIQAETKLLAKVLNAHGMREVSSSFISNDPCDNLFQKKVYLKEAAVNS